MGKRLTTIDEQIIAYSSKRELDCPHCGKPNIAYLLDEWGRVTFVIEMKDDRSYTAHSC